MRWVIVLALASCYSPRAPYCEPCSGITECPGGLACISGTCQEALGACEARDDSGTEALPPDVPSGCLGAKTPPFFEVCPEMIAPGTYTIPTTINTDNDCTYVDPAAAGKPESCVIAAERIIGTNMTRVRGARPLVLFARDLFELSGELDLAGRSTDGELAPGAANANYCKEQNGNTGNSGGGGPGATFRARGGTGAGGEGAAARPSNPIDPAAGLLLTGGCRGGDGGIGQQAVAGGLGGNGGGAIYIVSPMLAISGRINASGGGARAGLEASGGGGGGSGGMILIWSPVAAISLTSEITALGGGGGAGGGDPTGIGKRGDDPGGPNDPASEMAPNLNGGAGGGGGGSLDFKGASGVVGTTAGGGEVGAGGGGGGSVGFIKVLPLVMSTAFGPPAS